MRYANELLVPQVVSVDKRTRGEYHHIDLDHSIFDQEIKLVGRFLGHKWMADGFLDVGCGIGSKLFTVSGWDCSDAPRVVGIDNTPEYVEAAKKYRDILSVNHKWLKNIEIYLADALEYNYSGFKVIYFYRPISDGAKQKQLEDRIHSTMDVGSLLLSNLPNYDYDRHIVRYEDDGKMPIWETMNMPANFRLLWADYDSKNFIHRKES